MSDESYAGCAGGHDPRKVTRLQAAVEQKGKPTVILARTIKGYGLGEAAKGKRHASAKKLTKTSCASFVRDLEFR